MQSQIEVKWHGRTFPVDITEGDIGTCTVLQLKEKCHQFTGLPVENMKVLAYGAVMKDDSLTLGHYGVRPGSKLQLMGSSKADRVDNSTTTTATATKTAKKAPATHVAEQQTLEDLQLIVDKLNKTILPEISAYEDQVKTYNLVPGHDKDKKVQEKLVNRGLYFAEILMQLLFEFDGVKCGLGFDQSRQLRKDGVSTAQDLLDKVDRLRNSVQN
ncbi:unnamed protein product [Absidia cylindrospora]